MTLFFYNHIDEEGFKESCVSNLDTVQEQSKSTLQQIMEADKDIFTAMPSMLAPIINQNNEIEISNTDINYLAHFLNPTYLVPKTVEETAM